MIASEIAPGAHAVAGQPLLRGNFFAESSYLNTDIALGVIRNRAGTRICVLTSDFLKGFRRAIIDECGSAADAVFKSCGRRWGTLFAKRFDKELSEFYGQPVGQFTLAFFQACLTELFSHSGWGKLTLDCSRHPRGLIQLELDNAVMAELVTESSDRPVDTLLTGIFAGFFSVLSNEELDCVQTECPSCGGGTSRFLIGLGARLEPVAEWVAQRRSHEDIVAQLLGQ